MSYENPMPGNMLRTVEFDEDYEGGSFRRHPWYPGMDGQPNTITSEVVEKDPFGPFHQPKYRARRGNGDFYGYEPLHRPVLDIDFPAKLIPSSTEGHFHLYLDKEMTWEQYEKLLLALVEADILEPGYVSASIARGHTCVRLPGVSKERDPS